MHSPAREIALLAAGAALYATAAGCGSGDGLAPAAEPARSPPLASPPVGRVVHVGQRPEGLAFDPDTGLLAVGLGRPGRIALVDGRSGRTVRMVRLPARARHLQLARRGGPVLVPAERADELVEVFLPDGRLRATEVGDQPHDAARAHARLFVGNERDRSVSVVERGREVERLDAPVGPGGVAVTGDRRLVAVVGVRERALQLFDAATLARAEKLDVGIGPTHVVARGARLFVVDTRGGGLIEVHTDPLVVHRRTHLGGAPYGIAFDPVRRRFWVTLTATNRLAELTDRRLLRTFPTVRQPNSVAVDPVSGRVFVAGRRDGTLQLFDPPP
jgi:DNA-binding beta-propeller fold protein YncE